LKVKEKIFFKEKLITFAILKSVFLKRFRLQKKDKWQKI
tara:strand:+ start:4538 stop:4654 length:117 start_codon:yes stop_codon:yes gene_type:complete